MVIAGFEHVGPRVGIDDVVLSEDAARHFYKVARLGTDTTGLYLNDTESFMRNYSAAESAIPDIWGDVDAAHRQRVIAKTYQIDRPPHDTDGDVTSYQRGIVHLIQFHDDKDIKVYDTYEVEQIEDRILLARHSMRVSQALGSVALQRTGEQLEDRRVRNVYERPIQDDDVQKIEQAVHRVMMCQSMLSRT